MKQKQFKNIAIIAGALMMISLASYAIAGKGYQEQKTGGAAECPFLKSQKAHGDNHGMYHDADTDLTRAEADQIKALCSEFRTSTNDLRQKINEKKAALRQELDKETPDRTVAGEIQAELSDLKAEMAQKRLDQKIALKKINPEAGNFCMWKGQHGKMKGYHGKKGCWQ